MNIDSNEKKVEFLDFFLDRYLERGFGTLSKSEIDMLMMHLLMEHSSLKYKPNHEISLDLKLSETKVKNLIHKAKLQFIDNHDDYVKAEFLALLHKSKLETEKSKVIMVIEDAFVKQGIQARLKSLGHFADNSFNAELVKISLNSFYELLRSFYSNDDIAQFEDELNAALEKDAENKIEFKGLLKDFLSGASTKAGEKAMEAAFAFATGGTSEIAPLINSAKAILAPETAN
ncbi:hypothetical protein [Vibrio lentus]|uniref:Uncharacterized protein n=2 Tax=Vibrionaceae TaxID=641 RepID=A0A2N7BIG1_9VIBR|nr:hypothetical protein [Vibrio lentus]PME55112.1 hypothetical protein BCV34_21175 [Vibrio lentus]PME55783.1 hypothetical protein BCV30_19990 [Vibrio lentus]PME91153.1 hypothetical protein BCV27_22225 [Vibrio lentus]PMG77069.1 hypothetical protein BCU86_21825 [Vibrio lentus]PMH93774.1 hypothetical protein BCU56_21605 [Vibrio lentus]